MLDVHLLIKTLLILILGIISPGPDFFMVLRNSLMHGRYAGILSALGVTTGCFISFPLLIVGLKILFAYPWVKMGLSLLCGSYLIYLGWKSFFAPLHPRNWVPDATQTARRETYFLNGLLTNILNPKLYTISGAILAYVEVQSPSLTTNIAIVIGNAVLALIWFVMVSYMLTHTKIRSRYFKRERMLNRMLGIILIVVGARVIG